MKLEWLEVHYVPHMHDEQAWHQWCYGTESTLLHHVAYLSQVFSLSLSLSLTICVHLKAHILGLLEYHVEWLESRDRLKDEQVSSAQSVEDPLYTIIASPRLALPRHMHDRSPSSSRAYSLLCSCIWTRFYCRTRWRCFDDWGAV